MNFGISAQCERYHDMRLLSAKESVLVKIFGVFLAGFHVGGANILGKLAGEKIGRVGMLLVLARGAGTRKLMGLLAF